MRNLVLVTGVSFIVACSSGGSGGAMGADAGADASGGTGAVGGGGGVAGSGGAPPAMDAGAAYSDCESCDPMGCFLLGGNGLSCVPGCSADGSCPPPPSGTAQPICDPTPAPGGHPNGICALQCTSPMEQAECPDGMLCFAADSSPFAGNVCGWPARCLVPGDGPCAVHPADCPGCGTDETCDLNPLSLAAGGTICRAAGSVPSLGGCDPAALDCGSGHTCVGQPTGLCRAFCSVHADCGGGQCRPIRVDAPPAPAVPGAAVCSTPCNPFDPSDTTAPFVGCPAGVGCKTRSVEGGPGITDCTVADPGLVEGDVCTVFCAPGLMCLPDAADASRCQKPCIIGASPSDCTAGTCESLDVSLGGLGELGYCRLP